MEAIHLFSRKDVLTHFRYPQTPRCHTIDVSRSQSHWRGYWARSQEGRYVRTASRVIHSGNITTPIPIPLSGGSCSSVEKNSIGKKIDKTTNNSSNERVETFSLIYFIEILFFFARLSCLVLCSRRNNGGNLAMS